MDKTFSEEYLLTPSESNAQQQLPVSLLISQIIELATAHANHLGIGFLKLDSMRVGWVLSRLTVEMRRWPAVGEKYKITTWVETWNRHYSERCFSITDSSGATVGFARTVWVIIDLDTHRSVGTANISFSEQLISDIPCPIQRQTKHRPFDFQKCVEYTFQYTDLDFYRHVNTVKYVLLLLNQFPLECYDTSTLSRFEIAFMNEAHFGEKAMIYSIEEETDTPEFVADVFRKKSLTTTFDIKTVDKPVLRSRMTFSLPENQKG